MVTEAISQIKRNESSYCSASKVTSEAQSSSKGTGSDAGDNLGTL